MEVTSLNLHHGSFLMEFTPLKVPHGPYILVVTSYNVHYGSYLMELTPWNLPHGTYTIKLPHGTYTMEDT